MYVDSQATCTSAAATTGSKYERRHHQRRRLEVEEEYEHEISTRIHDINIKISLFSKKSNKSSFHPVPVQTSFL